MFELKEELVGPDLTPAIREKLGVALARAIKSEDLIAVVTSVGFEDIRITLHLETSRDRFVTVKRLGDKLTG